MTTSAEFQTRIDKSVTNMNRLDAIVNGDVDTVVMTDGGLVPSFAKLAAEFTGWSPVLAVVADGNRRVLRVADWTLVSDNASTKPPSGQYLGPAGFVETAAAATDFRGMIGLTGAKGDPGGNVMSVGLFSDLPGMSIPAGTDRVETTGWGLKGRGKGAYIDATGETLDPAGEGIWWATTANARKFKLATTSPDVEQFGADPTGTLDSTAAFNAAKVFGAPVLFMQGREYRISHWDLDQNIEVIGGGRWSTKLRIQGVGTYDTIKYGLLARGRPASGLSAMVTLRGFQVVFESGDPDQDGLLITRKLYTSDLFINGAPRDGVVFRSLNMSTEAPYFCRLVTTWSKNSGRDGCRLTNNCNANTFEDCQFDSNGAHGYNEVLVDNGQPTGVYSNRLTGGQASYNQLHGIFKQAGAHLEVFGTYAEFNSAVDGGNPKTGAYKNLQLGTNATRCFIVLGEQGTDIDLDQTVGLNTNTSNFVSIGGQVLTPNARMRLGYPGVGTGREIVFEGAGGCTHQIVFREGATDIFRIRYNGTPSAPDNELVFEAYFNNTEWREVLKFTNNGRLSFFGGPTAAKPTVTGSRGGNAALGSLLTGLAALGLIDNQSTT